MAIAATRDINLAETLGTITGKEASALGINWAFAPVVDIDSNFRNPITNTRTFGNDANVVAEMGAAYIKAIQNQGVAASAKHFPGDGVDERDQHLLASINSLSIEEWDASYGKIYSAAIDSDVKTIMVGHILQPAYSKALNPQLSDKDILPGLIAEELLKELLRNKLGFNGLIVSDSSTMAGLGTVMPRSEAVPLVIAAGCDMFLFTKNMEEDYSFMRSGVERGIISSERLDEAVMRILALKASMNLHKKNNLPDYNLIQSSLGCMEHQKIAKKIADKSITLVKEEKGVLPISPQKYPRMLLNRDAVQIEKDIEEKSKAAIKYFYDKDLGLFVSGKDRQLSYATNVWFVLAEILSKEKNSELLVKLEKSEALKPVTPYMMHHYVQAMINSDQSEKAYSVMTKYWGGMINDGADTFYELYNPQNPEESPYGSVIINSYCHAWSCTPTYFLRKYFCEG